VLVEVARVLEPHRLCGQLYNLAKAFTDFYEACPVLSAADSVRTNRLALCQLTARTLRQGLSLLGIAAPEHMEAEGPVDIPRADRSHLPSLNSKLSERSHRPTRQVREMTVLTRRSLLIGGTAIAVLGVTGAVSASDTSGFPRENVFTL